MIPALMVDDLKRQGVATPAGALPLGLVKDADGNNIFYYKGSNPPPAFLSEIDTLIGDYFSDPFLERKPDIEYFSSFDWDTTKVGFFDLKVPDPRKFVRIYYTCHQPTGMVGGKIWFRKIEATLSNNVVISLWEKYILESTGTGG